MRLALVVSALQAEQARYARRAAELGLSPSEAWNTLVVLQLRDVLLELARARGAEPHLLERGRLFASFPGFEADARAAKRARLAEEVRLQQAALPAAGPELPIEALGQLYESLLAARPRDTEHTLRKRTGSYYTPESLTRVVVERAMDALEAMLADEGLARRPLRILDPALGAGAFLVQAGRETARRSGRSLADVVQHELFGVDVSPLAVAVAEASLWLLANEPRLSLAAAGARLREADALCTPAAARALGRQGADFAELAGTADGFDLVVGNPPWVAFAGRATQPLTPHLREHYRREFRAFRGYPTLHGLFVELAARLAPRGVVALLIPSPVADLAGYRHVRGVLNASHAPCEPLLELGQDAFENVTQPCFALIAKPRAGPAEHPERAFVLSERRRALGAASELSTPPALLRLGSMLRLPAELFGEMGLQTNSAVSRQLLYRGSTPPPEFSYALLEGRNVLEFALMSPRLFLKPDLKLLLEQRCRLRDLSDYARVKIVVRQTAAITIAAAHDGTAFRNSLLAGFELPQFPRFLTLGLLNSTLYRALHLAGQRDARQGAFPQVKVMHLRSLPAPPHASSHERIALVAQRACQAGLSSGLRLALDEAVYAAFQISPQEAVEIGHFVRDLSPKAGLTVPFT
jgi:hypothetical protein